LCQDGNLLLTNAVVELIFHEVHIDNKGSLCTAVGPHKERKREKEKATEKVEYIGFRF
jgi:hypothetical protein